MLFIDAAIGTGSVAFLEFTAMRREKNGRIFSGSTFVTSARGRVVGDQAGGCKSTKGSKPKKGVVGCGLFYIIFFYILEYEYMLQKKSI